MVSACYQLHTPAALTDLLNSSAEVTACFSRFFHKTAVLLPHRAIELHYVEANT